MVLDGAMGSLIQEYGLTEADFRGALFVDWPVQLKGNNDVLSLTRPDVVAEIHRRYLEAGADILITDTFSSQRVSQQEYHLGDYVVQMNREAVRIARQEADRMTLITPEKPRFVLGDVGPTSRMLSMSDDVNDPAARSITFQELEDAYAEQIGTLISEGVDGILIETAFDTLNVKAATSAFHRVSGLDAADSSKPRIPLFISMTISDASGRTLSGQTIEAFVTSVLHAKPLCIGMNCGLGADAMLPYIRRMREAVEVVNGSSPATPIYISCHPNAGLPNQFGGYDDTPEDMVRQTAPMLREGLIDVIGGCCGTTPDHIKAIVEAVPSVKVRYIPSGKAADESTSGDGTKAEARHALTLSGLEPYAFSERDFIVVGERCNVAGSRKFLRLINEKKYDEALDIARTQIEKGAMVIDVNMDDGLLDARTEMRTFLNLLASDPSICRVPVMVDSSRFDVIEEGLQCCQGKCIVNSISLKQGEAEFLSHARTIKRLGAAVIVMLFDEDGQATDFERRIAIAERAYKLLVNEVGINPDDIIFDPNVLTIATGMEEHRNYARDFIRAAEWITLNLPGARISGGLSNLSFAFRGNNYLREAMHSVFLHHAKAVGMNMAIMNPATAVHYEEIAPELRDVLSAVIMNTDASAQDRLMEMAQELLEKQQAAKAAKTTAPAKKPEEPTAAEGPELRLTEALLKGTSATLEADINSLISKGMTPLDIISGPLMQGMNKVGKLFGEGLMFLPQVVKTARTMKKAVEIMEPFMAELKGNNDADGKAGKSLKETSETRKGNGNILLATVKGDVHDIGKNIVGVVLSCNGFNVIDLGVMVPAERIVSAAIEQKADIVCLSGLITPSLDEMCSVAKAMQEAGLEVPLFVGGATTSPVHTAVKIAPLYRGGVFHLRDASQNPVLAMQLLDPQQRYETLERNRMMQQRTRLAQKRKEQRLAIHRMTSDALGELSPLQRRFSCRWDTYEPAVPESIGEVVHEPIAVKTLVPYIDWLYFYWAWRVKEDSEEGRLLRADAEALLAEMTEEGDAYSVRAITAFYPAQSTDSAIEFTLRKNEHDANCPCCNAKVTVPTPRQSITTQTGMRREQCLSLCDFVSPLGGDYAGAFAATMSPQFVERLESLKAKGNDDYQTILLQTIGDRLAEAASEYLGRNIRGIRPAVGYPSLPDQKSIFLLNKLIDYSKIGIRLTENGAMYPQASVTGLYIQHPDATYFGM